MAELRRFVFSAALIVVAGFAAHRIFGANADPFTTVILITVAQISWGEYRSRRQQFRAAVAELRAFEKEQRQSLVAELESEADRRAFTQALLSERTETSDGTTEIFPLPKAYRRRLTLLYWRVWAASTIALVVAAFVPGISSIWRAGWIAAGLALLLYARRRTRYSAVLDSVIEINPYRISLVWPDGRRASISFSEGAVCEEVPEAQLLLVRSDDQAIPVSYHLIGYNRIVALMKEYGVKFPASPASAS
jgi:hypothetical protein